MHRIHRPSWLLLILLVLQLIWVQGLWAKETRHALVIGNAAYVRQPVLRNTLNDARDISAKLQELGFNVTKLENADRRELGRGVNDFIRKVQGSDGTVLVYYSGHGLQVNGRNYLLPVDVQIKDELDVPLEGLAMDRILQGLGGRGDQAVNLIILDACRDNPYKTSSQRAIGDKGLARVTAPGGSLILYATKPGDTASDNPGGRNGLFTKHLLKAMDRPGLQVEEAFKQVANNVWTESGRRQFPWQEGAILGRFYFRSHSITGSPSASPSLSLRPIISCNNSMLLVRRPRYGTTFFDLRCNNGLLCFARIPRQLQSTQQDLL